MGETSKKAPNTVNLSLRSLGRSRGTVVGIHLEEDGLRLAKISQAQVVDCRYVPYTRGLAISSVEFVGVLKSALSGFLRHERGAAIWVAYDFPDLNMRQLRLPRMPSRQLSNAVYWSFRKETQFDEQASVFDFLVDGEAAEGEARKTVVTAYVVNAERVRELRTAFDRAGYSVAGITLPMFGFRNLFTAGWIAVSDPTAVCLYIGEHESDIMVFSNKEIPTMRVIKTGLRALADLASQNTGGVLTVERARKMIPALGRGETQEPLPEGTPSQDALFGMVEPGLGRLVRQIEQTVSSSPATSKMDQLRKVYVSGPVWLSPRILTYMTEQMGVSLQVINPLAAHGSLRGGAVPDADAALAATAVGVALSDPDRTPNLLRTHKEKEHEVRVRRFNIGVLVALAVGLMMLGGVFFYHWARLWSERITRTELESRLGDLEVKLDMGRITKEAGKASERLVEVRQAAREHRITAVISEVIELTPATIRLTAIGIEVPPSAAPAATPPAEASTAPAATPAPATPAAPGVPATLKLEGLVLGDRGSQDAILAKYAMDLDDSALLKGAKLTRQSEAKEVPGALSFALAVDLAEGR